MSFADAFAFTVGEEGGLSMDPQDPGNWTGGKVGIGQLKGTKYGISAAQYPGLDIADLTLDQARAIYKPGYWDKVSGDLIPDAIAGALFDTAVNEGPETAIHAAQKALGIPADGVAGPQTIAALNAVDLHHFARAFAITRIVQYASMQLWTEDHNGWVGRVLDLYANMVK